MFDLGIRQIAQETIPEECRGQYQVDSLWLCNVNNWDCVCRSCKRSVEVDDSVL